MEDLDGESHLGMTEVYPPVPPVTREAPAAEPGAGDGGGAEGNPPTPSVSLGGPISVASMAAVAAAAATTAAPAVTGATATTTTTAGTFLRLRGDLGVTWRFLVSSPHCKADAQGLSRKA